MEYASDDDDFGLEEDDIQNQDDTGEDSMQTNASFG